MILRAEQGMKPDAIHSEKKSQAVMIYTDDVKKELDAILKAFENYIDGQNYFDIVYSKKSAMSGL